VGKVSVLWGKFKPEFHRFGAIRLNLPCVALYSLGMMTLTHIRNFRLWGLCFVVCLQSLVADDAFPSILDLQRSYVEANGGHSNLQALSSLIASGKIIDEKGNRYDFKLFRKRPDKMRMQVDFPSRSLTTVYDGSQVFQEISTQGAPDVIEELVGEAAASTKADGSMDGPFYQLRSRPEWLEVVAEVDIEGMPAYEIVISDRADSPYQRVWIGKEHQQEVKLSRLIESDDRGEVLEEIYFSDFEKVRGVWMAKHIRYMRDGKLTQTVQIEEVRANVGIFNSFFAKPRNP